MPRIGLAFGGGGSRGAFSVGVLDALIELTGESDFPVVAGTSTGALIAALACNREFGNLRHFYTHVETGNIVNPRHPIAAALLGNTGAAAAAAIFGNESVFESDALARLIDAYADMDKAKSRKDVCRLILSTVSLETGAMVLFDNKTHAPATLRRALLASASEPVFMPPVQIRACNRNDRYVDGGLRELLPLGPVFGAGVELDAVLAVSTNPIEPKLHEGPYDSLMDILGRTMDILLGEVQSNDFEGARRVNAILKMVENARAAGISDGDLFAGVDPDIPRWIEGKRHVPVLHIGPETHIDVDSLDFARDKMTRLMTQGRKRGAKLLRPFLAKL